MADDDQEKMPSKRTAILLATRSRLLLGIFGVLMAAVPSVGALWRGLDGAGTVAFVIAACLAVVIGVAGRLPTKVWSGDKGAEFWADEATEVADLSMSQYTPDQLQQLISSSTSPSGEAQPSSLLVAGRAAQHLAFESNASAMVKSVIRENRWQHQTWNSYLESLKLPPRRPRDGDPIIVRTGGPRSVLIDISFVYTVPRIITMIQAARDLEANLILITYLPHRLGLPLDDFQQQLDYARLMLCSSNPQLIKTAVQHLSGATENMRVPAGATFVAIDGVNAK